MNKIKATAKISAGIVIGFGIMAPASAQTYDAFSPGNLSFSRSEDRDTWHTVLIASAVIGIVGLASGDGTLTVLGAAGVVLSLVETDQNRFRYGRGFDLLHRGPISLGISPFGQAGYPGFRPSAYVQYVFKF